MKDRVKCELADFNHKTREYEEVVCSCGEWLFIPFLPFYDERGISEESYCCIGCQSIYHWAHGNVVEKIEEGVDWLLQKVEDGHNAKNNVGALRRDIRSLEQENKELKKKLEELS